MLQSQPELQWIPLDGFRRDLRQICGAFDVDHDHGHLNGYAKTVSKGGLDFALVGQTANVIRRTRANIKSDPGNHFFLVMQTKGRALMRQNDTETVLGEGDMFLVDSTRPSSFVYNQQASQQVSLHLPREETVHRFGRLVTGGMAIRGNDPLGQAMGSILTELLDDHSVRLGRVSEAFYGVLGAYLFKRGDGEIAQTNPDRQIVNRALQVISQHYADPDFTPTHLAQKTGVSLRKLQRAFAVLETSPHKRLQDFRLNAVCEQLDGVLGCDNVSVASLAFECGFSDLSTFYRTFRKRFGCAPGDRRALQ